MENCRYKPEYVGPFGTKEETTGFRFRNNHDYDDKRTKQPHKPSPLQMPFRPTIQVHWHDIMCNWYYKLPTICKVVPKITDDLEPYY